MSKLNATHRFILAMTFIVISLGLIFGAYFFEISDFLKGLLNGVCGSGIIIVLQFYFRTSSDAEKKEAIVDNKPGN